MINEQRHSKQRQIILGLLKNTTAHPTAERVYEEAKKQLPHLSLGTVYRNLRFLAERGEIQELSLGTTFSRYDGNAENHGHFICQSCGRVLDIDYPPLDAVNDRVARDTGLKISFHKLAFYGVCLGCQAKEIK